MAQQEEAITREEGPSARGILGLERADDLPVGAQLAWRLRVLIASGQLRPGDRLPGIRELAAGTELNVNTARAVYGRLEHEGLIESRHGLGTFDSPAAPTFPELARLAADATASALAEGIDPRDLARAIYAGSGSIEGAPPDPPGDVPTELNLEEADERPARRALRDQIARLEAELASYPDARGEGEPTHPLLRPKGHIAGMGELEAIRDELLQRLRRARAAAEKRGERQRRARARLEEMVADPAAHRWESVSNEDLGEPGCASYDVEPRWGPVGALMNWWRVRVSSGCPLAAAA